MKRLTDNQYMALRDGWFAGTNGFSIYDKRTARSLIDAGLVTYEATGPGSLRYVNTPDGNAAYATDHRTNPAPMWTLVVQAVTALEELMKLRGVWHGNIHYVIDSRRPWRAYEAMRSWHRAMAAETDIPHGVLMGQIATGLDLALGNGNLEALKHVVEDIRAEIAKEKVCSSENTSS